MEIIVPNLDYEEEWKCLPFDGFEHYMVSNYGRIKNSKNGIIRNGKDNGHGYISVTLKSNGKQKYIYIHREVARAFLCDFNERLQVNHKDKNKSHNYVTNLEMVTDSQNKKHSYEEYLDGHLKSQGKILYVYDLQKNLVGEYLGVYKYCRENNIYPKDLWTAMNKKNGVYRGLIYTYDKFNNNIEV